MKSDRTVIGMFDSGIGGLSVLHEALKSLPEPEYLYYADTDHVPYGTKSVGEIRCFTDEIIRFLVSHGADAVIIACNTATSAAVSLMRERYDIPIIGMEPAVKPALLLTESDADEETDFQNRQRVLVLATPLTLRESKLETLIAKYDSHHSVDKLPAEELVHFAERDEFDEEKIVDYLEEILNPFDRCAYGAVVLGCTHFNYFLPELRKVFPRETHFIDGVGGTIRRTADLLGLRIMDKPQRKNEVAGVADAGQVNTSSATAESKETEKVLSLQDMTRARYFFSGREVTAPKELERIENLHARLESCNIG